MTLPPHAYFPFTPEMRICRLLNGLWQLSGAHGTINPQRAIPEMLDYHQAGFTTWDLADHYGPAEDFIAQFRHLLAQQEGESALRASLFFTKWVPRPGRMTRSIVEEAVNLSLRRMNVPTLDLLQFHWWEYSNPNDLEALRHLTDLKAEGKIRHLALTNYDTEHLARLIENDIPIIANQVQYSLVDRRPAQRMAAYCQQHGIHLLTYGTFCGGLLSERYLNAAEPGLSQLTTASLRKYKNMIDAWGGWAVFQQLLHTLHTIAQKHQVSLSNVAVRAILDQPAVAGVIVGTRLSIAEHRAENARVFSFTLDAEDQQQIEAVQGRDLLRVIGDCGAEYRR
jgi:aryl-alcohol dehydrogenase-like predicted oxidoreductase